MESKFLDAYCVTMHRMTNVRASSCLQEVVVETNRENKAHTATANRIAQRYQTQYNAGPGFDIETEGFIVEVETTATIENAVARLREARRRCYLALTNKDGVREALKLVKGTELGVMDPQGKIIRDAGARED